MPRTFSILKTKIPRYDWKLFDNRILPFLDKWSAVESYKGKKVYFHSKGKGTWNSEIFPYKYFQVLKDSNDPNFSEEEHEIQCYVSVGWPGYDDEVIIILGIYGKDVTSGKNKVSAEILKPSGAPVTLYFSGKFVTNFSKSSAHAKKLSNKIYVSDMNVFLNPKRATRYTGFW